MIGIGVAVAMVAVAGIGLLLLNGSSSDGTLVFDWPAAYRADTNISIDGDAQTIPSSGPWEYRYPSGSHRIVADHLAYKLDTLVDLAAGSQQAVPADWKPKAVLVLNWPRRCERGGIENRWPRSNHFAARAAGSARRTGPANDCDHTPR